MKKALIIFVILVAGLATALTLRLRQQQLEAGRPSGGSATIEGVVSDVVPRIGARIATLTVEEGDAVKAGQVVVTLECDEPLAVLHQAEAQLAAGEAAVPQVDLAVELAKTAIANAQLQATAATAVADATRAQRQALNVQRKAAARQTKRLETLEAAGVTSEATLDQTRTQVASLGQQLQAISANASAADAQASVVAGGENTAKVQLRIAEAKAAAVQKDLDVARAAVARAKVTVGECTLRAPRDGIVQSRPFDPGEVAMPGSRLLTVIDIRTVKATFYLPNAELGDAAPGRKVVVVADAYPSVTFDGTIRRVGTSAEFTPRNVQTREDRDRLVYAVEVAIPNADGRLRPGMPVEVTLPGTGTTPSGAAP